MTKPADLRDATDECGGQFRTLFAMDGLAVGEYRCSGCPAESEIEAAPYPEIVLPQEGAYLRYDDRGSVYLDRSVVAFFEAGRPYSVKHIEARPDISTVISLTGDQATVLRPERSGDCSMRFNRAAVRATSAIHALHRSLLLHLRRQSSRMVVEDVAARLVDLALELADGSADLAQQASGETVDWQETICVAIAEYLNANYRRPVTLEELAGYAGYSVFHLCRMFQARMKTSIYQYVTRLRLEAAMALLLETELSITDVAFDLGFSSSSHFTRQFTLWSGVPPSSIRRLALA